LKDEPPEVRRVCVRVSYFFIKCGYLGGKKKIGKKVTHARRESEDEMTRCHELENLIDTSEGRDTGL